MTVEILRPFDGYAVGEHVDASGWLHTEALIDQRFCRPVYSAPAEKPATQTGRRRTEG